MLTLIPDSLKEATREKLSKGKRKKLEQNTKLSGDWRNFLLDSSNKEELAALLLQRIETFKYPSQGKKIFIILRDNVMYIVIVYPMKSRSLCTTSNCRKVLFVVWILAIILTAPVLITNYWRSVSQPEVEDKRKYETTHIAFFRFIEDFQDIRASKASHSSEATTNT
ncbi:hypothetical protein GQR58_028663 [Nymphon striatum]|nr:hypothetical protein GQR58_028663 [Nymphon striatum]